MLGELARRLAPCQHRAMREADMREVWSMLDEEHLARVACRGPEVVFATLSGAHLYGFASPDSDVDVRGAVLFPLESMLGLSPPDETLTIAEKEPVDVDFVAHDLRKFVRMMVSHNGYALEQLFSPLVLLEGPELGPLRALGRGCITRPLVRHYLGFSRGRRARLREPEPTVKHLLYAYRVLLAGIHVMKTGEIESNLGVLSDAHPSSHLLELIDRKKRGHETMALLPQEVEHEEAHLEQLETELHAAHAASRLPEAPTTVEQLEALVIEARLSRGGVR